MAITEQDEWFFWVPPLNRKVTHEDETVTRTRNRRARHGIDRDPSGPRDVLAGSPDPAVASTPGARSPGGGHPAVGAAHFEPRHERPHRFFRGRWRVEPRTRTAAPDSVRPRDPRHRRLPQLRGDQVTSLSASPDRGASKFQYPRTR